MKKLFKKLLIFAFVLAICFSTLLCRPSRASAAEAEADSNLNMQQLAKDFDFITKFYVKDDCLLGIDITNHDFILSSDVIECNYIYEPHMSLPDYTPTYTGFYSFSGNNSIAITVKAGVDIIEFCGYSMSYFDLSKTIYDATGNALYINTTGEISNEGASFSYFAYIGQSEVDRTVVIKSSDFIEPCFFLQKKNYSAS